MTRELNAHLNVSHVKCVLLFWDTLVNIWAKDLKIHLAFLTLTLKPVAPGLICLCTQSRYCLHIAVPVYR